MKDTFIKGRGCLDSNWDCVEIPDLFHHEAEPTLFNVGQCYEDQPAKKIICAECGGDQFNVGQGDCFTAIRCVNCEWETGIHEG